MSAHWNTLRRWTLGATLLAFAAPAFAQQKIAVIDVARIMTESERGKAVIHTGHLFESTPRPPACFSR